MIKVVIVDDSRTERLALRRALESDPDVLVVGEAASGEEALNAVQRYHPDLITMDVYLADENGLDVTSDIMATCARPILVVTGVDPSDPRLLYQALSRGALDVCPKLPAADHPAYSEQRRVLLGMVKSLSRIPVVHRGSPAKTRGWEREPRAKPTPIRNLSPSAPPREKRAPAIVLVGASTGGPPLIGALLSQLPPSLPVPVVLAQHISEGFGAGFVDWLAISTKLRVELVSRPVPVQPGTVYVAPDNRSIGFASADWLRPMPPPAGTFVSPCIDVLFATGAEHFGSAAIGVLLTGMGRDGAAGMKALFEAGAFTIAQQLQSCAVDSMPKAAVALGAAGALLRPEEIAPALLRRLKGTVQGGKSR